MFNKGGEGGGNNENKNEIVRFFRVLYICRLLARRQPLEHMATSDMSSVGLTLTTKHLRKHQNQMAHHTPGLSVTCRAPPTSTPIFLLFPPAAVAAAIPPTGSALLSRRRNSSSIAARATARASSGAPRRRRCRRARARAGKAFSSSPRGQQPTSASRCLACTRGDDELVVLTEVDDCFLPPPLPP